MPVDSDYIRNEIYPLLRHDLKHHTKIIPIERWAECILGVSQTKLLCWETCLQNQHLLIDPVITKSMKCYCTAKSDEDCHDPWAMVVNRINIVAQRLQNIPQTSLSDLFFVRNHRSIVDGDEPHYAQPDVLIVQKSSLSKLPPLGTSTEATSNRTLHDIVSCVHFTRRHTLQESYSDWESWLSPAASRMPPSEKHRRRAAGVSTVYRYMMRCAHRSVSQLEDPPHVTTPPMPISAPLPRMAVTPLTLRLSCRRKRKPDWATFPLSKRAKIEERGNDSEAEDILETVEDRAAGCALAILSSTSNTRQHCLQLIVDGPELQLWYYDAGGIIRSESMNWIKEFSKFAAIMVAFASLDPSGWGIGIPNLVPPPSQLSTPLVLPTSLTGYSLTMAYRTQEDGKDIERNVRVELGKEITTQASLVGRRTTVYEVSTTPKISSVPLILKMSMQPTGKSLRWLRPLARRLGVRRLPHNLHNDALMILATLIISTSPFFAKPLVLVSSRKALNLRDASLSMFETARTSR